MAPVHIFLGGSELLAWTEMSLSRSKDNMTGQLNISLFMGMMPDQPVVVDAVHGKEVLVYIGGHLAFWGTVDKRRGTGTKHGKVGTTVNTEPKDADPSGDSAGPSRSVNIGPNEYTVQLTCRGKTKVLVDSSHQHPTTNFKNTTDKQVATKLCEPWGIEIEWTGEEIKLDRYRLRDGAIVFDELSRICREQCHFMYETRDGKLRCTDDIGPTQGEPLILGTNILTFSAEQSEDNSKSQLKIKGQRTRRDVWGEAAVLPGVKEMRDEWVQTFIPTIVMHYGDGSPEALERRGRFEANKRSSASKNVTIEVFHVQTTSGEPWDIGQLHYVEVPPEGIFDEMECTELTYTVQNDSTINTKLTMSPPPTKGVTGGSTGQLLGSISSEQLDLAQVGTQRRMAMGITFAPGSYPQPWSGPVLSLVPPVASIIGSVVTILSSIGSERPPLKLRSDFVSEKPPGAK